MSITAAIVLFAMIWFMMFLIILPLRLRTQGETGEIVPGTHSSAPADPRIRRKALMATMITVVLWAVIAGIIVSGIISVRDLDWFGRMGPRDAG